MRILIVAMSVLGAAAAPGQLVSEVPRSDVACADGPVYFSTEYDGTLYVAGNFDNVGPLTGGAASLDPVTAEADLTFPRLNGDVNKIVSDGEGGLYIVGDFDADGDGVNENEIRILADGTVGPWSPVVEGEVADLVRVGNQVYMVGPFGKVDNKSRTGLARVDAITGKLDAFWVPYTAGIPTSVLYTGGRVIISGPFTQADGQPRRALAAYDPGTGALLPFDPIAPGDNQSVTAMAVSGDTLYIGGFFGLPGQPADRRVSAVSVTTGLPSGWTRTYVDGGIYALALGPGSVYVGGNFSKIGGIVRSAAAALAIGDAAVLPWAPILTNAGNLPRVYGLAVGSDQVYLAGEFYTVGGEDRFTAGAVDPANGTPTSWSPRRAGGHDTAVFADDQRVVVGGSAYLANAEARTHVAAIDLASGLVTPWNPVIEAWNPGGGWFVHSVARRDDTVYLAGSGWETINGTTTGGLAAVDAQTGQNIAEFSPGFEFDPNHNDVNALHLSGDTLYAFGQRLLGQNQHQVGLFALDAQTGERRTFSARDWLMARLFVGPDQRFGYSVNKYPGGQLNEFWLLTGEQTEWNPGLNAAVSSAVVSGSTIYVAGSFSKSGDQTRKALAAFTIVDDLTRTLLPWDPAPDKGSVSMVGQSNVLYVAGSFNSIGGAGQPKLAALDPLTGSALAWAPAVGADTFDVLSVGPGGLVVGATTHDFTIGGIYRRGFAILGRNP
jgi:trimeric autotransporter adhesin